MLKRWLAFPLKNLEKIRGRHQVITHLTEERGCPFINYRAAIKLMGDLERSNFQGGHREKSIPREVVQLKNSLEAIVPIKQLVSNTEVEALSLIGDKGLHDCDMLRSQDQGSSK